MFRLPAEATAFFLTETSIPAVRPAQWVPGALSFELGPRSYNSPPWEHQMPGVQPHRRHREKLRVWGQCKRPYQNETASQRGFWRTYADARALSEWQVRVGRSLLFIVLCEAFGIESFGVRIVEFVAVDGIDGDDDWSALLDQDGSSWDCVWLGAHSDEVRQRGVHPQRFWEHKHYIKWHEITG